jgi:hypothetical protein
MRPAAIDVFFNPAIVNQNISQPESPRLAMLFGNRDFTEQP